MPFFSTQNEMSSTYKTISSSLNSFPTVFLHTGKLQYILNLPNTRLLTTHTEGVLIIVYQEGRHLPVYIFIAFFLQLVCLFLVIHDKTESNMNKWIIEQI